jgi:hypothetical protein
MTSTQPSSEYAELDGGDSGQAFLSLAGRSVSASLGFRRQAAAGASIGGVGSPGAVAHQPPTQQVYRQTFEDGREVVFGVGMSGRGHWSVSFTLVPDLRSWIVELACCSPVQPEQLGSTYQLLGEDWAVDWNADETIQACQCPSLGLRLEPISGLTRLETNGAKLRVLPSCTLDSRSGSSGTETIQWGYRLRIHQAS